MNDDTWKSILAIASEEIEPPSQPLPQPYLRRADRPKWQHPASEAERVTELESFLAADFNLFREVWIACPSWSGPSVKCRVDVLAVPKAFDVALAIEVKGERFHVQSALKQSADYVGGRILEGPHIGKQIIACFLYPTISLHDEEAYYRGMFTLIGHWRVGRGFIDSYGYELTLAFGGDAIWRSKRGWTSMAHDMLLGKRTIGGSRR